LLSLLARSTFSAARWAARATFCGGTYCDRHAFLATIWFTWLTEAAKLLDGGLVRRQFAGAPAFIGL